MRVRWNEVRLESCDNLLHDYGNNKVAAALLVQNTLSKTIKHSIMKSTSLIIVLLLSVATSYAQTNETITFRFKNSSFLVKKLILISYTPGETGNGTQAFWMLPKGTKAFDFKVGTKLYLASQKQVNTVMGGERIDDEKPFLVVTSAMANKSIKF